MKHLKIGIIAAVITGLVLGTYVFSFGQAYKKNGWKWDKSARIISGDYQPELSDLDSFANNGGIPVHFSDTNVVYVYDSTVNSLLWYLNIYCLSIDSNVRNINLVTFSINTNIQAIKTINTSIDSNSQTTSAAAVAIQTNTGAEVVKLTSIDSNIININTTLTSIFLKQVSIDSNLQALNTYQKQLFQGFSLTIDSIAMTATKVISVNQIIIGGYVQASGAKITTAGLSGMTNNEQAMLNTILPTSLNINSFYGVQPTHTVTCGAQSIVIWVATLQH